MAEYTAVYISNILDKVRVVPLITYDCIPEKYSDHIRASFLLDAIKFYQDTYIHSIKVFEDTDPEIDIYANKLKLLQLLEK